MSERDSAVVEPLLEWSEIAQLLVHPTKLAILERLRQGPTAPVDFELDDQPVSKVAYHFKVLAKKGLIELDREEPARGAIKHYYRLAPIATQTQNGAP
jgi:DNA-binding transcriptional ArsR family regulator